MLAPTGVGVVGGDVPVAEVDVDNTGLVDGDNDEVTDVFELAPPHAARARLKHAATTQGFASAFISLPEYARRGSGMPVPVGSWALRSAEPSPRI
jgi:hypothetical protein